MDGRKDAKRRGSPREGGYGKRQPRREGQGGRMRAQPTEPRGSSCSLSQGRPPVTSPTDRRPSPGASAAGRRQSPAAREAAVERAEEEQRQAIERYRPFIRVAAVSVSPRPTSPDHFGLRRHTTTSSPREDASRERTHRRH